MLRDKVHGNLMRTTPSVLIRYVTITLSECQTRFYYSFVFSRSQSVSPQWSTYCAVLVTYSDIVNITLHCLSTKLYGATRHYITNVTKYPTDDWLTISTFFNHPIMAYQSGTSTVNYFSFCLSFTRPN